MREIKFRAWIESQNYMAIQGTPDLETLKSFMFHYGDEKTLMQFTGLKDKNEQMIFDFDIIYSNYHGKIMIIFFGKDLRYRLSDSLIDMEDNSYSLNETVIEEGFVKKGNIFENPELLNQ